MGSGFALSTGLITLIAVSNWSAYAAPAPQLLVSASQGLSWLSADLYEASGAQTELRMFAHWSWEHWALELGGGWTRSDLAGGGRAGSGLGGFALETRAALAEVSPLFRPRGTSIELGPVAEILFGPDVSFAPLGPGHFRQSSLFWTGGQGFFSSRLGQQGIWRAGLRYLRTLGLGDRRLETLSACLQLGWGP